LANAIATVSSAGARADEIEKNDEVTARTRPPPATSGQNNLTRGRIAAAHGLFSRIRQVALMSIPTSLI